MRLAVLASGSGTNLQALLDHADSAPHIAVVITDRPGAGAVARAERAGVAVEVVPWTGDRTSHTRAVCDAVTAHDCEAMVLAGFMRILGPEAIDRFPCRIINIHPSLLPAFPGAHAVAQALAHGVKLTGVTVHFVDEEVDHGPVIAQRAVPVQPDDTEASLHARIQTEEHALLPEVVGALVTDRLGVDGRRVTWEPA